MDASSTSEGCVVSQLSSMEPSSDGGGAGCQSSQSLSSVLSLS